MKKLFLLLAVIFIGILAFTSGYFNVEPRLQSKSAILMDASTGKILYEKDTETPYPIASMSKMMTEYIVLEHIKEGLIKWEDEVIISQTANDVIPGAAILPVESGDSLTVEELLSAMTISSANNAAIALAETISGTEDAFTLLMNEKAVQMGLSDKTLFVNSTGLPNAGMNNQENEMTAIDVATLAYHLLNDYPDVLNTTSHQNYYIKHSDITIYTTNKMLMTENNDTYFQPVDGLKTGYTDAAGYCFTGTAYKNDQRLISVVINSPGDDERFIETKRLLEFGFGEFNFVETIKSTVNQLKEKR